MRLKVDFTTSAWQVGFNLFSPFLEKLLNRPRQLLHFSRGRLSAHDLAVLVKEKLGKVPLNIGIILKFWFAA